MDQNGSQVASIGAKPPPKKDFAAGSHQDGLTGNPYLLLIYIYIRINFLLLERFTFKLSGYVEPNPQQREKKKDMTWVRIKIFNAFEIFSSFHHTTPLIQQKNNTKIALLILKSFTPLKTNMTLDNTHFYIIQ